MSNLSDEVSVHVSRNMTLGHFTYTKWDELGPSDVHHHHTIVVIFPIMSLKNVK